MVTLSRSEYDGIFRKPEDYLFFVREEVSDGKGGVVERYVIYRGDKPLLGSQGQGIDFQQEGTRIRFGRIPAGGGSTEWGEWIETKGEKGDSAGVGSDGNWSDGSEGVMGYVVQVNPENPVMGSDGVVATGEGEAVLEVRAFKVNLRGERVSLTSTELGAMRVRATYVYGAGSGVSSERTETFEFGEDGLDDPRGNGEADADEPLRHFGHENGAVDADEASGKIDERAPRIPLVDRRVRLDEVFVAVEAETVPAERGNDARGDGLTYAEGIADREHGLTDG